MHGRAIPGGVRIATVSNRRCATQFDGVHRADRSNFLHCPGGIGRIPTSSPVLQNADLSTHRSSVRQGAWRGSRVSGSSRRQVGNRVASSFQTSGKCLLSISAAEPGLATGVCPPRNSSSQPLRRGSCASHSA
jgi:hypothetical protein